MIHYAQGDIFDTPADIRVNTVNCVGVMGAGVALAFKTRYPAMFKEYKRECKSGNMKPGKLHIWKPIIGGEWVINFPTKRHWRQPSRMEDIEAGLKALRDYLSEQGKVKVALPALGCGHGGLEWNAVLEKIKAYLADIEAEILVFEPSASHAAGRAAIEGDESTLEELHRSGVRIIEPGNQEYPSQLKGRSAAVLYVRGKSQVFETNLFGVLASSNPIEREIEAAKACVELIAKPGITLFTGYGPAIERPMICLALDKGADVAIMLPDGILNFKVRKDLLDVWDEDRTTIISAAPPRQTWSPVLAAKARDKIFSISKATLITDPVPEWLARIREQMTDFDLPEIFHINYQNKDLMIQSTLKMIGSHAIGRDPASGKPNVEPIIDCLTGSRDMKSPDTAPYGQEPESAITATGVAEPPLGESRSGVYIEETPAFENPLKYPKRLIEVDLPIKRISAHARREKSIRHGHISTLHIWWARRPLASCRAVICAALWPDPADPLCPLSFRQTADHEMRAFAAAAAADKEVANICDSESWKGYCALNKNKEPIDPMYLRGFLLDFIADFAAWEASTNKVFLQTARNLTQSAHEALGGAPGTRPLVVDPFAGGDRSLSKPCVWVLTPLPAT